jgi:diguanylate cyclase (GGDEF)-like protein/PAS domain S-box-containing protein
LLESTKAIPWKLEWSSKKFTYIGPQIERLLGWSVATWGNLEDWVARIHPEDRDGVANFCLVQSQAGLDHEADYRALVKDGGYVWLRDVVHVVRDEKGEIDSLIGFLLDVSEQKETERKLLRLQKELEELSYKDSLTGVGNRRMFDSVMDLAWTNAQRNSQPLSLLLLDIDHFKQYNDHYGHIPGDECLKRVANVLSSVVAREKDSLARLGGEEFALILPETSAPAANLVADRCRTLILNEQIPHKNSQIGSVLTVSLGVGTIVPSLEDQPMRFIETVDRLLYQAKRGGRNRIVAAAQ